MRTTLQVPLHDSSGRQIPRAQLEKIGIKVLSTSDEGENIRLPRGWTVVGSDPNHGLDLLDEERHWRGHIEPPGQKYPGFLHLLPRYWPSIDDTQGWESPVCCRVFDMGAIYYGAPDEEWPFIFQSCQEFEGDGERTGDYREMSEKAKQEVLDWLNAQYPDWEDFTAYWFR